MDSDKARQLFDKLAGAVAYIEVEDAQRDRSIGSAFHVGEGVFVTARHVVEGKSVLRVATTQRVYVPLQGEEAEKARVFLAGPDDERRPVHRIAPSTLRIVDGPHFHTDPSIDVAVFKVAGLDLKTPYVELGSHLDDWLGERDFVLSEALILGFPPVPLTNGPHLIAARAEVNAHFGVRDGQHVHFVLSAMPRGGFSGGLAYSEWGFALGVITRSLIENDRPAELGFFTVLSVEPIFVCLADAKLLPKVQAEGWDDFWNLDSWYFGLRSLHGAIELAASVDLFEDGERCYVEVRCDDANLLERAYSAAEGAVPAARRRRTETGGAARRFVIEATADDVPQLLRSALDAAADVLEEGGLVSVRDRTREK